MGLPIAGAVLAAALVRHDFSFAYVAAHTSRTLPTMYALSAFWGGQEGSLLLWLLILTGYAALAVWVNRVRARDLVARRAVPPPGEEVTRAPAGVLHLREQLDLLGRERRRLLAGPDEPRDLGRVLDDMPRVVGHVHLDQIGRAHV